MLYVPREEGQGLVEYALILIMVAMVVIVILSLLGPIIGNVFSNVIKRSKLPHTRGGAGRPYACFLIGFYQI